MSKKNRRRITASCSAILAQARWLIGLRNGQRLLARMLALRSWLTRGLAGGAIAAALIVAPLRASGPFIDQSPLSTGRPAFVDFDGDGDLDAFVGQPDGSIAYFRNDGDATSFAFVRQTGSANPFDGIDVGYYAAPAFVDIDNDGDLDAFVGNNTGTLRYFEPDSAGTFVEQAAGNPLAAVDVGFYSVPAFADIDNDGDFDAFVGEQYGNILYYRNNGSAGAPDFSDQTGVTNPLAGVNVNSYAAPTFIDIDNDSDQDLFIATGDGALRYFRNDGGVFSEQAAANPFAGINTGSDAALAFGDLDGDSDVDAFLGQKNDRLLFYRNTGSPAAPAFTFESSFLLETVNVTRYASPAFVDIDADGDADAFVGADDGTISYYRNNGSATTPDFNDQTGVTNPLAGIDVGGNAAPDFVDIDNDGDFDAFVGTDAGTILYYRNNGSASAPDFADQTGVTNPLAGVNLGSYIQATPAFVDIDSDGDYDVFIGEKNGTVFYYENTGSASTPVFEERTADANPFNGIDPGFEVVPTFVDIDRDDDYDAFIGEEAGIVFYYENTGSATTPTFTAQTGSANPLAGFNVRANAAPAFVDIDADGDADAFVGNFYGRLSFYLNTAVPAAPTDLSASVASPTQIDLSWSDPNTVETAYVVERSPDGNTWSEIASLPPDSTSYSDTGLAEETNYFYRVQARNNNFSSPFATVSASTDPAVPAAPTGLSVTAVSATQVDLSWTDASTNETGFVVERSPDGSTWSDIATLPADSTSYSDTGLSASTTYYYRVRAVRSGASDSAPTTAASVTTPDFRIHLPAVIR